MSVKGSESHELLLKCPKCGSSYPSSLSDFRCPKDGEPLLVYSEKAFIHHDLLRFTLGEGKTPLVRRGKTFLKLEYLNPTGSFKDRGAATAISFLIGKDVHTIIEDSSGNAGIAYSCYGSAAGFHVRVYVPSDVPEGKYALMRGCGAEVIRSGTRNEAHEKALTDRSGVYVGHTINPYFIEGTKLIAKELLEDLGKRALSDSTIFAPVASGTLILGLWKGFKELLLSGEIEELPRVVAVQACGYSYLTHFNPGKVISLECKEGEMTSFADALRLTKGERGRQVYEALKEMSDELVIVGDPAGKAAFKELIKSGFLAEPTSSLAYAASKYYLKQGRANQVIVPLTGSALKFIPADKRLWNVLGIS
jgi:threonine synthase